jgi:hypothetical protein
MRQVSGQEEPRSVKHTDDTTNGIAREKEKELAGISRDKTYGFGSGYYVNIPGGSSSTSCIHIITFRSESS